MMRLPKPSAPFERLEVHGESITIDIDAKNLVIPTGNQNILPLYNEYILQVERRQPNTGSHTLTHDFDSDTGLKNSSVPWIALYNPESSIVDFFLFSHHMKKLSYKKNENGTIYEITLFPGNGAIYHGQVFYAKMHQIPQKTVYGWWYQSTSPSVYTPNWDYLAQIIFGFWYPRSDGTLYSPSDLTNFNGVKLAASTHNVPLIIGINKGSAPIIDNILANNSSTFANNLLSVLQSTEASGINIDFEGMNSTNSITGTSNTQLFENLLNIIHTTLKTSNPSYQISFCVAYSIENQYRNINLDQYIDSVFLMGYDYVWPTSTNAGPNSPCNDSTRDDLDGSISILRSYFSPSKIIVGLPFYGYEWPTSTENIGSPTSGAGTSYPIQNMIQYATTYGRLWDENSNSPWYKYQKDGVWHQGWYDDAESLAIKYKYITSLNLKGVGIWEMGYEGNMLEIWDAFSVPYRSDIPPCFDSAIIGSVTSFLKSRGFADEIEGTHRYKFSDGSYYRTSDSQYYYTRDI